MDRVSYSIDEFKMPELWNCYLLKIEGPDFLSYLYCLKDLRTNFVMDVLRSKDATQYDFCHPTTFRKVSFFLDWNLW